MLGCMAQNGPFEQAKVIQESAEVPPAEASLMEIPEIEEESHVTAIANLEQLQAMPVEMPKTNTKVPIRTPSACGDKFAHA